MDLQEEEVGGDDVVEEPKLGYYASHRFASFQALHKKPLLGISCWTFHQLRMGPSYQKGVRRMTEAPWSRLHHSRLPANFSQSEATFVFTLR